MFEQSLYEQPSAPTSSEGSDLFKNYEIKTWEKSSRLYKILGISAIGNILAILIVAQTSLLTMKGCDSPLVGRVCSVLDVVYVSSMLFGTERQMADAEYDKTELSESDITFVDVTGVAPPLSYPEGYFQLANPEQFQPGIDPSMAAINTYPGMDLSSGATSMPIPPPSGNLLDTPPVLPPSNPNAITGELPSFDTGTTSSYKPPRPRRTPRVKSSTNPTETIDDNAVATLPKASPSPLPSVSPTPAGTPDPDASKEDKNGVFLNKRPLADYAKIARAKIEEGKVKLESPFTVSVSADISRAKDGKTVVLKNVKPLDAKNDPEMVKLAQDAILAVGDSGWFGYFDKFKVKKVVITLVQSDTELQVAVKADQPTENEAKQMASGLNVLIALGKNTSDGDEKYFLERAATSSEGKSFFLKFLLPKQTALEMIKRKLDEPAKAENKPSSSLAGDKAPRNSTR